MPRQPSGPHSKPACAAASRHSALHWNAWQPDVQPVRQLQRPRLQRTPALLRMPLPNSVRRTSGLLRRRLCGTSKTSTGL